MSLDVLLVTDDDDFQSSLAALESFAHTVSRVPRADRGGAHLGSADVAIIDARTDLSAAGSACRRLTAGLPAIAVVAVVAPGDFGAIDVDLHFDDVLLPGAGAEELQTRLRLAITRRRSAVHGTLKFGELLLNPASFSGSLDGRDLALTLTEFKLLNFLVQHAGRAFTRTRLMHEVWGYDCNARVRTVDVHVRRLRAKLGAEHESVVDTVRGVGYMAATPPHPEWILSSTSAPGWTAAPTTDSIAH